ncbi:hypothetical protein LTR84_011968 [Exophiala bonariae]|uniref:Uncharacterized protein n=1 Tax=Exophiala bonariae TaxID=1690606 RepID=A0AAV9MRW7_9EURO|nr:hypothetical protein LTR84_011968 [Exophiala bonariae]
MEDDTQVAISSTGVNPDHIILFSKQLKENERLPNGYLQSWQDVQKAAQDSTARLFLDAGGFNAWLAYILVKQNAEKQSHFRGKAAFSTLINELEATPAEYRKALAGAVASSTETRVRDRMQNVYEKLIKESQNDILQQNKRRRTTDCEGSLPTTSGDMPSPPAASSSAVYLSIDRSPQGQRLVYLSSDMFTGTEQEVVNGSLAEIGKFFPPYLSKAIRRIQDPSNENAFVATISMTFPDARVTTMIECQMALEITANKVEHMAKELFNAHLETTEGLRYICLPGGARVVPNPKFTLRGCRHDIISSMFGLETYAAVMASPPYQVEAKLGHDTTECISMVISQGANDVAIVFLSLGLREGTLIADKLRLR